MTNITERKIAMKAELDEKGTLVVTAQSPLESFALSHWYTLWDKGEAVFLITTVERSGDGRPIKNRLTEIEPQP